MGERRRRFATLLGGLSATALLGAGVFAISSDTGSSPGNTIQSDQYTPAGHDLVMANPESFNQCTTATYTDALPATVTINDYDLASTEGQITEFQWFCLKNNGSQPAKLTVAFTNLVQSELGCSPNEFEAGDGSCGGGAGELGALVNAAWSNSADPAGDPDCLFSDSEPQTLEADRGPYVLNASLPPGAFCQFPLVISPTFAPVTEDHRFRAQSDRIQWDIVFTLEDVIA